MMVIFQLPFAIYYEKITLLLALLPIFAKFMAFGQVAQLVEQWTENPRVAGSSPALPIS